MKRQGLLAVGFLAACCQLGCASGGGDERLAVFATGPLYNPEPADDRSARVVIYQTREHRVGAFIRPRVVVDEWELGTLLPGGFLEHQAAAGSIEVRVRWEMMPSSGRLAEAEDSQSLVVQPGEVVYLRTIPRHGMFNPELTLERVAGSQALAEVIHTRSCHVVQPRQQADGRSDMAEVRVLRQSSIASQSVPEVFLGDISLGRLGVGEELAALVPPGVRLMAIRWSGRNPLGVGIMREYPRDLLGQRTTLVRLEPGESYRFSVGFSTLGDTWGTVAYVRPYDENSRAAIIEDEGP